MSIAVLVPGVLRGDCDGRARLVVEAAGTLGNVLAEVDRQWPRLGRRLRDERGEIRRYVNVYVNGEDARRSGGLATPVPDSAEIEVIPSVAGG